MIEVALTLPLLIMLVLALVEMGIVFASYISLANGAREGVIFAAMHPELADATCGAIPNPDCTGPYDDSTFGGGTRTRWDEYTTRVRDEVVALVTDPLKAGQVVDQDTLTVDRPIVGPAPGWQCPGSDPKNAGCPITVTVHYRLHTFMTDMSLPGVGRLGLPNYYQINYTVGMPIR